MVIGLEDYAFVPDVDYASRDAQAMRDWLVYTRGVPVEHVRMRTSGSAEQLLASVQEAAGLVGDDGLLWVYFAGHGMASPQTGGRMLLGDDARPDYDTIEHRALLVDTLLAESEGAGVATVLLVDACFTGKGRGGQALIEGRPLLPVAARAPARPALVWSGASAD